MKENNNIYFMPSLNNNDTYINKCAIEQKKSKFYSFAYYIDTEEEAKKIIDSMRKRYADASHLVFAYRLINSGKYSDDKEPKNTAGKPIYDVLEKKNLINILIIVIRYFGGTLLGSGLLTRTYISACLNLLSDIKLKEYSKLEIKEYTVDYKDENILLETLKQNEAVIMEITRDDKVHIKVKEKKT